jgi:hypothetical protein
MSIKDLFNKKNYSQISKAVPLSSASLEAEGSAMIEAKRKQFDRFVPPINFGSASSYAKFGSAEMYYENSFKRIYQQYPYDGTLAEKTEFENSSSYLDRYIFDNIYPRTNGYAVFSAQGTAATKIAGNGAAQGFSRPTTAEYIYIQGGPHTASGGMVNKKFSNTFDNSMVYDVVSGSKKGSSLETKMISGSTIEFWMKKDTFVSGNSKQVIFDLWNGMRNQDHNDDYGRLTLMLSRSTNTGDQPFTLTLRSGSSGFNNLPLGSSQASSSVVDGNWHHYALTIHSASQSSLKIELFVDGDLDYVTGSNRNYIPEIPIKTNGLNAYIGALITSSLDNTATRAGDAKLSASLDDFRFWKVARTPEQINHTWNIPIGGGSNKHDSNKDLGVYYKFNEGVTTTASVDSVVLDYSGRICNGEWTGYASGSRKTTSALVESGKVDREFKDPIIYSHHPDVTASIRQYRASGSYADKENSSMFYSLFPAWMQETDTQNGKQLKKLSQIISSYFDTLWHQINFLNKMHDKEYITGSSKALPFAKNLLQNQGFMMPDLFVDSTIAERFLKKNESHVFEKELIETKNLIYQNIYNNLSFIYKSKGTEKSFRNFFRSVGINSELVKLKMYADDSTYVLRDNLQVKSYEKNFINFNTEFNMGGTIFQTSSSADKANSFIHSGSEEMNKAFTIETEIVLPLKTTIASSNYFTTNFLTASIVGLEFPSSNPDLYTQASGSKDLHIIVARDKYDHQLYDGDYQTVRFGLSSSHNSIGVQYGPRMYNQYKDNKWNLSLTFKDQKYPHTSFISGNITTPPIYDVCLYGIETDGTISRNNFKLETTSTASVIVASRKRLYAGAHRTAYTGSIKHNTDIKLGSVRYWQCFVPTGAIAQHAFDPQSYGTTRTFMPDTILESSASISRADMLVLHWGFNNLTGSGPEGQLRVSDMSSGSYSDSSLSKTYGEEDTRLLKSMHMGRGYGFLANSTSSINKEYLYAAKKAQPDDLYSSDLIKIHDNSSENFFIDDDVSDNFYSFEKSLYGVISQEMLNMFATVKDFSNLIGQPNQKYHSEYNQLNTLKNLFFEDIENNPDIEKFTRFYKWIDDSISAAISQLIPASARFSNSINNMVESHVLERNKYANRVGLLTRRESTEGAIKGSTELLYNWRTGHAPLNTGNQRLNCLWWSDRADSPETGRHSGSINTIRDVINNHTLQSAGLIRRQSDGTVYYGSTYPIRKLAKPYNLEAIIRKTIHGGVNFANSTNKFFFLNAVHPHGTQASAPNNVITVGAGAGTTGIIGKQLCDDVVLPINKFKFGIEARVGKNSGDYNYKLKGNSIFPFNFVSGTVHTGYNAETKRNYRSDVIITNLHSDITDLTNEVPMQGPFTETHVGGHQSRHVRLNRYDADAPLEKARLHGGTASAGIIRLTSSNGSVVVGDAVRVQDFDQTQVVAQFDTYFDMYNSKWSTVSELKDILEDKLDVTITHITSTTGSHTIDTLRLTLSELGTDGNSRIISSSCATAGAIETVTFAGGANPNATTTTDLFLDDSSTRPEAFGIVMKEHPVISDADGAFGVVGADYGSSYPNTAKAWAIRYRDEHAKRPVNIRNIQYNSSSTVVGNYRKGYEIFTLQRADQKRWYRDAVDAGLHLPRHLTASLPDTTNYLSLFGPAPFEGGNFFGSGSNRTPDASDAETTDGIFTRIVRTVNTKAYFDVRLNTTGAGTPQSYTVGYLRLTRATADPYQIYSFRWSTTVTNGNTTVLSAGPGAGSQIQVDVRVVANDWETSKQNFYDAINTAYVGNALSASFPDGNGSIATPIRIHENVSLGTAGNGGGAHSITSAWIASFGLTFAGGTTTHFRRTAKDLVIEIPRTDLTSSTHEIVNRFSAPGGPEINTTGYLDVISNSYSAYNAMPFRNLSVLNDSGEESKIRVVDHLNKRRGLRSLLAVHQGRGGLDSQYLTVLTASNYGHSGSYVKQHRNTFRRLQFSGDSIITGSKNDNGYFSSTIPRSDFQYGWINAAITGSNFRNKQRILGHAPASGMVTSSVGPLEAIVFPTSSHLQSN